jgi:AcrR family transcriptional regulator
MMADRVDPGYEGASMSLAAKAPEERRRRILMAAVDVLRERGYSGTRVVDIAEAAGTSSGLVLYHFKSLEGVLAQALTTLEDDFYEGLARDLQATSGPVERLRYMGELGAGAGPAVGDWSLWLEIWVRALRDDGARLTREALDSRWRSALREVIDEGVASGEFAPRDAEATTTRLASLMDGLAIQLALADPGMTPTRMRDLWLESASLELAAEIRPADIGSR